MDLDNLHNPFYIVQKYDDEEKIEHIEKASDGQLPQIDEDIFLVCESDDADDYIRPYLSSDILTDNKISRAFDFESFDEKFFMSDTDIIKLLINIPTKPPLKKFERFNIKTRILNIKEYFGQNIILHATSNDFIVHEPFLSVNSDGYFDNIELTKKHNSESMKLTVEIFMDNVVSYRTTINIWDRVDEFRK